jgi:hypothetical protein
MIIYNVTVKIDASVVEDWEQWMKEVHIPDVMATKIFKEAALRRIYIEHEDGNPSYAIQYKCESMDDLERYQREFAARLQADHTERYKDRYVAFRTVMHETDTFLP